jgi:hypothetical protein
MGGDLIDRYDAAFVRLAKSKFRSRFHLLTADKKYIAEQGIVDFPMAWIERENETTSPRRCFVLSIFVLL